MAAWISGSSVISGGTWFSVRGVRLGVAVQVSEWHIYGCNGDSHLFGLLSTRHLFDLKALSGPGRLLSACRRTFSWAVGAHCLGGSCLPLLV